MQCSRLFGFEDSSRDVLLFFCSFVFCWSVLPIFCFSYLRSSAVLFSILSLFHSFILLFICYSFLLLFLFFSILLNSILLLFGSSDLLFICSSFLLVFSRLVLLLFRSSDLLFFFILFSSYPFLVFFFPSVHLYFACLSFCRSVYWILTNKPTTSSCQTFQKEFQT